MYISLNWLKDFVKIPSKISPLEIAQKLTNHTAEVEGFINQAQQFDKVVIGKVLTVRKHPNADRLRLASVDIKTATLEIVCGAPNLAEGQLVPVALVGAILPNGLEIKESEIRGEKSSGMICAEDELGIGKNHEGIVVLNSRAKIGGNFSDYLKVDDVIFELDNKSLSSRPDLLSHYGIARELSAIFDWELKAYNQIINKKIKFLSGKNSQLEIKVDDKDACPRYLALKIDNITVQESPAWLKDKLIAVNQKPINNIVDLTNYVLLELGQPLHAFNADKVKKILVRSAREGEKIETLDEKERVLSSDDLVISDGEQVLAIAGIMGGKDSGVTDSTTSIILESANFKAATIRRTSQKLGLRSEASTRYEKSLDPSLTEEALYRFINLLSKILPNARISSALTEINYVKVEEKIIELDLNWLNKKIGQIIPRDRVINNLKKLGFEIADEKAEILLVTVPSWRATKDVSIKEDLVEEILRLFGYNNIESRLPLEELALPKINEERLLERKIKNILALKYGLSEVYNYSFVGEEQLKKLDIEFFKHLRIMNPVSDTQTMLKQSLVPNLVSSVKNNQARPESFGLFEVGSVFFNAPGNLKKEAIGDEVIPYQEKHLGLVLAGNETDLFTQLKGMVDNLFKSLVSYEAEAIFVEPSELPGWADKVLAAKIVFLGREMGTVAMLSQAASANLNIKKSVALAELNFKELSDLVLNLENYKFQELAKYPSVSRDLAFVLNEKILYNEIKIEIIKFNPLIKKVDLFDVYSGDKLANDEKGLAFRVVFQADDRTLKTEEVDMVIKDLLDHLQKRFEARLRE